MAAPMPFAWISSFTASERAHLGEVRPHDVQRSAADDFAIQPGNLKVANGLVDFDDRSMEHVALIGPVGDELMDRLGIR